MLSLHGVSKGFCDAGRGVVPALDGCTVSFAPGVTALIGANGAGKTTLLRVLAGLMTPDAGEIRYQGVTMPTGRVDWRRRIGFCTLSTKPPGRLTVTEYLRYLAVMHHLPEPERTADTVMQDLGITEFAQSFGDRLSTGQAQRCTLAAAMIHSPPILLLDELTTGLDLVARTDVITIVRRAADAGRIILFATHHPMEIDQLASRVVALRKGAVVVDSPVDDLGHGRDLEAAMLAAITG
jgi:ABC-type multidrug transport system ATPase subunit